MLYQPQAIPENIYMANKSQISIYVLYLPYYCRAFTCINGKGSQRFCVSRRQTNTSPITLDRAHLLVNVVSSNNRFIINYEWTRVTSGAYNRNINKRQARKLIWLRKLCYSSQILQQQMLLLEGKFDGSQKLCLANYTRCTVCHLSSLQFLVCILTNVLRNMTSIIDVATMKHFRISP